MNNKLRQKILKEINTLINEIDTPDMSYQQAAQIAKDLVGPLDGWVDAWDIKNVLSLLQKTANKKASGRKGGVFPALQVVAYVYSQEENGDKIEDDINAITTRTVSVDGIEALEDVKEILTKYLPGGTPKSLDSSTTPSPDSSPQPKPDTGGGGTAFGKSFQCKPGTVAQFQNWLKKQGQAVCADDKFGQKTFAAAKALGNAKLDFSMYNSLDDFKDQAKKDQLCNAIAGDSRWRAESSTPEVCGRSGGGGKRKTSASTKLIPGMKPSTSTAGFVDVNVKPQELINLGYTGQFIKADSAIPDSQMQKVSIDPKLLTVLEKGKDYQQLEESKNFYDNKKLIEAKSLFNKLTKSLI